MTVVHSLATMNLVFESRRFTLALHAKYEYFNYICITKMVKAILTIDGIMIIKFYL